MREILWMAYPWIKALHIIAVIAWMAGLMYLPRLFIYHHQSKPGGEAEEKFREMERNLLKLIINPSMIAVWLLAGLMLFINPQLFKTGWFGVKFLAVMGISAIHGVYAGAQRRFYAGERPKTEKFWRIINEAPFILMMIAVLLAVTKPF